MKIISAGCRRLSPDQILDAEIQRLQNDLVSPHAHISLSIPKISKQRYLKSLETFERDRSYIKAYESHRDAQIYSNSDTFHCFGRLPIELRCKIWEYTFTTQPRVHCIKEIRFIPGETFISNQPIPPIAQCSRESRYIYLSRTESVFAFETFINFDTDLIYVVDLDNEAESFPRFWEYADSACIQHLAMRKELFCETPLPGHMPERYIYMRVELDAWMETVIVFRDTRTRDELWEDVGMQFVDLTSRQKRMGRGSHAVMYARKHARYFMELPSKFEGLEDLTQIKYRFVVVDNTEDLDISFGAMDLG